MAGWRSGRARNRPVTDAGLRCSACAVPAATTRPPRTPAPGPKIDDVIGAANRILVVLDHHQGVAGVAS
jgi:hypothetical protein